jgi:nitrogen fixation-related uncharacterized protein
MVMYNPVVMAVLFGSIAMFGGAAAIALAWAYRNGQLENFHRSARSIFDPDEPIGTMTDTFPAAASAERLEDRTAHG